MPAFVFDLGGTHLRCGVVNSALRVDGLEKQRASTFVDGLTVAEIVDDVVLRIIRYIDRHATPDAAGPIVLAFPGPIAQRRFTLSAPTLYGTAGPNLPDLAAILTARTGRTVHLLNDVSAAAWSLSTTTKAERFMVVTVSSGIGSKLFDRRHPLGVIDDPPYAGEIGHYVVDRSPDAIQCDCGGRGHLGGISSGRGIERLARRVRGEATLTNEACLVPAIRRGERWATDILREATIPLAQTLLAVTMACGLERVFIIGGFAQSVGPLYGAVLEDLMEVHSQYAVFGNQLASLVQIAGPREEQCIEGAAVYAGSLGILA